MLTIHQPATISFQCWRSILRILSTPSLSFSPHIIVLLCIPVVIVSYLIAGYYVILAPGKLYNALVSEDWNLFRSEITKFALILTLVLIIKVLRGALRQSASNLLRLSLTEAIHNLYFPHNNNQHNYVAPPYYKLTTTNPIIDNPDQRIATDTRDFAVSFFDILAGGRSQGQDSGGVLEALASLLLYSNQTFLRTGWYGLVVAYLWSFFVSIVTVFVVNRTSPVVFRQERIEADFRYAHAQVRKHAEEIALLSGGQFEHRKLSSNLNMAISNTWVLVQRHVFLNFIQYGFSYYISLIMYLALALAIHTDVFKSSSLMFSANMTPGEKAQWISQTGGVFIQLLYSFTMLIQLGTAVSEFVSYANRVSALLDATDSGRISPSNSHQRPYSEPLIQEAHRTLQQNVSVGVSDSIRAENLVVEPSPGKLIGPISFSVQHGQWVLLSGRAGAGKTSVIKVLRGLWQPASGTVQMPSHENGVMFLPQNPYISPGLCSLRQLLVYPLESEGTAEETGSVASALQEVGWRRGLSSPDLDFKTDWSSQLSRGEAQLIAASRIVFHRPDYAVLDEPTASLDISSESRVITALKKAGISALTIGHSPSLREHHETVVELLTV